MYRVKLKRESFLFSFFFFFFQGEVERTEQKNTMTGKEQKKNIHCRVTCQSPREDSEPICLRQMSRPRMKCKEWKQRTGRKKEDEKNGREKRRGNYDESGGGGERKKKREGWGRSRTLQLMFHTPFILKLIRWPEMKASALNKIGGVSFKKKRTWRSRARLKNEEQGIS